MVACLFLENRDFQKVNILNDARFRLKVVFRLAFLLSPVSVALSISLNQPDV